MRDMQLPTEHKERGEECHLMKQSISEQRIPTDKIPEMKFVVSLEIMPACINYCHLPVAATPRGNTWKHLSAKLETNREDLSCLWVRS